MKKTKLFGVLSLLTMLLVGAQTLSAQPVSLTFSMSDTTIERVMDKIEEETDLSFLVLDRSLAITKGVSSFNVNSESLDQVLDRLFAGTGISWRRVDKQIMLTSVSAQAATESAQQQGNRLTGRVVDQAGEPLVGATVAVEGTTNAVITDANGNFELQVPENATLQITYFGYITALESVGGRTNIAITMQQDNQMIDEVVIVGYGTQKKVNLTGAITNVKTAELSAIPSANLSNSLAGRAPGVMIEGNSGLVGSTSSIRIRGAFGEPLFVIDGVITNKEAFDALDATEIDQLSFLKDAASASVYGSSAGNGVVLVTTKKGDAGVSKPRFEYQGSYTFKDTTQPLFTDLFNATDELIYQNRVDEFLGRPARNGQNEFDYFKNRDYNVNDWIWQTPWDTKHSLSVTGGSENIQYYMMANFQKEEGSYLNTNNDKYNIRSNVTAKLSKAISANLNLSAYQTNGTRFYWREADHDSQDIYDMYRATFNAMRTLPFYSYLDGTPAEPGVITEYPIRPEIGSWTGWNPVDMVIGNRNVKTRKRNFNGTMTFNVDLGGLTPGLSTRVLFNYTGDDYMRKAFMTHQKQYIFQRADPEGNRFLPAPLDPTKYSNFTFNTTEHLRYTMKTLWSEQFNWFVDYNRTFGKHGIAATAVFEQASNGGEQIQAQGEKPLAYIDQMFVFSNDRENRVANATEYVGGRLSWIGRLNYNYSDKYIAEFSFRYDGNTLFAPGKRWGFFPSASAAWRITQENFMESSKGWLSDLKLRASYGTTGNDLDVNNAVIAGFQYLPRYVAGTSYMFGSNYASGIAPGTTPNPNLTWATHTTYNVGIDFGFLNQKLTGTIDLQLSKETDILGPRTVSYPSSYGQTLAPENYAARSWRGGEFSLSWRDRAAGGQIQYSAYIQMGYTKNRWDVLDEAASYKTGNLTTLSRIGHSVDGFQTGLIAIDLIRTEAQVEELKAQGFKQYGRDPYLGGILYKDTRGDGYSLGPDGKIDGNDSYNVLSDNAVPRLDYGFGGEISWKGISLSAHFQGVGPYDKFVGGADGGFYQHGGQNRNYFPIWASDDLFTLENRDGKYPRVVGSGWYESGVGRTSFWKRNGAYLRLKNLNIGYRLPKVVTDFLSIDSAQVYFNGTNLFVISDILEFQDPEQRYYDSYPIMKSFTFGLNFSF